MNPDDIWHEDTQWSEGLISAAKLVVEATKGLSEAAHALMQGAGTEEKLISCATHVASSTMQLLIACKVKADPNSVNSRNLQVTRDIQFT